LVVAATDAASLLDLTTWYLRTTSRLRAGGRPRTEDNLPAAGWGQAEENKLLPADVAEVVRLYEPRSWVEQSYKQVKQPLGRAHYQLRKDLAIRRHWQLVMCAFTFC
jgi:hypothetical protein